MTRNDGLAAECREVVQVYPSASGPVHALRELSFGVPRGSLTVVVGPSGAGKSTLLRLLGGLERPTVGEVLIGGERTEHLSGRARRRMVGRRIGHVFQIPAQNLLDYLDVTEHVRLALRMRIREQPGAVDQLVEQVGLTDYARARPRELAAGQQQRLAFAMAVAGDPALIVADEPTASLDPEGAAILVALLGRLRAEGRTMVVSSHDDRLVNLADQMLVIRGGVLVAAGPPSALGPPAVIDASGRLALDADSLERFPGGRARIVPDGDDGGDGVRVVRP